MQISLQHEKKLLDGNWDRKSDNMESATLNLPWKTNVMFLDR